MPTAELFNHGCHCHQSCLLAVKMEEPPLPNPLRPAWSWAAALIGRVCLSLGQCPAADF